MLNYLPGQHVRCLGIKVMEFFRKTEGHKYLDSLNQTQWRPVQQLEQTQIIELRKYLMWCKKNVPFWTNLFEEIGFNPAEFSDFKHLQQLPLMEKKTIRDAGDSLLPIDGIERQRRYKCTSGSTGKPLNYYLDRKSHSFLWGHIWRAWGQVGYSPGDLYATLSGGSLLPEKVDFKQRMYLLLSGCLHLPCYHLTEEVMEKYFQYLLNKDVRFMYGYPSSLNMFSRYINSKSDNLKPIKAVFTTSELLTIEARSEIERAFQCKVFDIYGCNDAGLYSFECDQQKGFHQGMESCFVEVVDDQGNCVPDGEIDRIVTTHFANNSHPFIRYVTGDIGAIDKEQCDCGRGLIRIVKLNGRERDFILTADGRKVHGAFFNHFEPFYTNKWIERFQVWQGSIGHLEVRLSINSQPSDKEVNEVIAKLKEGLGDMEISIKFTEEMELTSTGKFRVVISEVD